jgi:hypothetical protein
MLTFGRIRGNFLLTLGLIKSVDVWGALLPVATAQTEGAIRDLLPDARQYRDNIQHWYSDKR